jgi:molybdopterin converting factor small subunit
VAIKGDPSVLKLAESTSIVSHRPVQVTCLFFAEARELAGTRRHVFELPAPQTLAQFKRESLLATFPDLERILAHCLFSVNLQYISRSDEATYLLAADCELGVLPPVSGG